MDKEEYLRVLADAMLPSAWSFHGLENFIFQHNNAPCHKAKVLSTWLEENNITVLDWPPQSPDMNPIEHLWDVLETKLKARVTTTMEQLWECLQKRGEGYHQRSWAIWLNQCQLGYRP
jgi:transposase